MSAGEKKPKRHVVNLEMPLPLIREIKLSAHDMDRTFSWLVRDFCRQGLEKTRLEKSMAADMAVRDFCRVGTEKQLKNQEG
jgi:hypothetical protein